MVYYGISELKKMGISDIYVTSSNAFYYKIGFEYLVRRIAFSDKIR